MGETRDYMSEEAGCSLQAVRTKGSFCMMELPVELRLKIYSHLLICDEDIMVNSPKESSSSPSTPSPRRQYPVHPSVAILQTCKLINEEGNPILYGRNKFINYLTMDPTPSYSLNNTFLLKTLRWSSISQISSLAFLSNSNPLPGIDKAFSGPPHARPTFYCTGADIMRRFTTHDMRYSPKGPDEYMALSLSNWVSTQVMRVMLIAFQRELEEMMRPTGMFGGVVVGNAATGGTSTTNDADHADTPNAVAGS